MSATPAGPLRVAHLITDLDVGGAEIMLARLVGALDPTRVESVVISLASGGPIARRIADAGIRVVELDMKAGAASVPAFYRAVRALGAIKPDVVHTWLYHADLVGLAAGAIAGSPALIWNIRCSELKNAPAKVRLILRLLAWSSHYPAAVVFNSHAGLQAHVRLGYHPRRSETIPNGIATGDVAVSPSARSAARRTMGVSDDVVLVGLIARLDPLKDHETFLRAAAAILERLQEVRFVLVGRGVVESPAIAALVRSLGLEPFVILLPEQEEVAPFTATLDLAVSSSWSEGFPNVLIEAMAAGVPCVATDAGDSASVLDDPDRIVPVRDPATLAAACLRVLQMRPDARKALGERDRARVGRLYTIDAVARRFMELYEEVAGVRREAATSPVLGGGGPDRPAC
jgi:glycosyltransferase involved in cell wall biosynthesis